MDKTWETKREVHFFANIKRKAQLLTTKHGVLAQGSSGFCIAQRCQQPFPQMAFSCWNYLLKAI